jgi:hypothetical protein
VLETVDACKTKCKQIERFFGLVSLSSCHTPPSHFKANRNQKRERVSVSFTHSALARWNICDEFVKTHENPSRRGGEESDEGSNIVSTVA